MKKRKNKIVDFDNHLDAEYGKRGELRREEFEPNYETFKLGVMLQELRKQKNMV